MTQRHQIAALCLLLTIMMASAGFAQTSGSQYRKTAIMNGNQVRTVFGNWGVIGQPGEQGRRGAWKNDNNGYIGDVSPLIGAEVKWNGVTFHSVATTPVARPTAERDEDPQTGKPWTLEPVVGYFNPNQEKVATSTDPNSWPQEWPDKMNDVGDPGWRGSWNGYFGKKVSADQETYFVMDDNNDERFNKTTNNILSIAFKPDSLKPSRNGMALEVRVRALQWAQFLAKDNIFWLYEITNTGTTTYDKAVFGMLVGTYVGVTSTGDQQEWNDDFSFYDPDYNITYTGDYKAINGQRMKNPLWVGGTGLVGYAFLESPGNPFDGIDNDGDVDSLGFGASAPKFTPSDFDSVTLTPGKRIVLIRDDFQRTLYTVPNADSVQVYTRGKSSWIYPGKTRVVEGNVLKDVQGNSFVNTNVYDGVDNNFNGLIDENYYVHYRQVKITPTVPPVVSFDILRELRHVNYLTGSGSNPLSMIDERRDDLIDNNNDWIAEFDDVGRDGIPNTKDFGEADTKPTSGYDANFNDTGLPGEPHIDKTDVRESDQIGLTSFNYFVPSNNFRLGNDESLWKQLLPGFFDVPRSIVNKRPQSGEDGDFIYGSGYFPLLAKSTERFSLALVYGGGVGGGLDADLADLLKNKKTVQKIYDANYQFPQPPDKPTLTAVPGDQEVTLYWDRKAEASIDPVLRVKTFEGYKIYKSTDPNFSDIFTITDGAGSPQGYRPAAQYDLVNGVKGYFQAAGEQYQGSSGYAIYLGNDNGLQHTFVDKEVDNGRRYYYAAVAYSRGDASVGIFPAENTKFISILPNGEIVHDINTVVVVPNTKAAGYVTPPTGLPLAHSVTFGTGTALYQVVDGTKVMPHRYHVEFFDTQVDTLDASGNPINSLDSTTWTRITTSYSVRDLEDLGERFTSVDTAVVTLSRKNLIASSVSVKNAQGTERPPSSYILNAKGGTIRGSSPGSLPPGEYTISYQYYPVYRSPNIQGTPYLTDSKDTDVFDGLQLAFNNYWTTVKIDSASGWVGTNAYQYSFSPTNLFQGTLLGYRRPGDYEFQFSSSFIDTSLANPDLLLEAVATPLKFRIYNRTDKTYIKCYYYDLSGLGQGALAPNVQVVYMERSPRGTYSPTWTSYFSNKEGTRDTLYNLGPNDKLVIKTDKPFHYGDVFEVKPVPPVVNAEKAIADLSQVKVVPNPYVTASEFELPLNPGITSGRGERKIDFIHLPAGATVRIFTSRGDLVVALQHSGSIDNGTVSWNLKTSENLDIAYGIYFYVVESTVGTKTGKIAIIK